MAKINRHHHNLFLNNPSALIHRTATANPVTPTKTHARPSSRAPITTMWRLDVPTGRFVVTVISVHSIIRPRSAPTSRSVSFARRRARACTNPSRVALVAAVCVRTATMYIHMVTTTPSEWQHCSKLGWKSTASLSLRLRRRRLREAPVVPAHHQLPKPCDKD